MLLCLVSAFAFAVLFPSEAHAEWVEVANKESTYEYVSDTLPSSFKVAPSNGNTAYSNLIDGTFYWAGSTTAKGPCWNTVPSGNAYLIRMHNLPTGALAKDNVIQLDMIGVVGINATTATSPANSDWSITRQYNATNYRYWVSKSGNNGLTEIFPNDEGVFVMPFDAQYIFVTSFVSFNTMSSFKFWFVPDTYGFAVLTERPEDQNEVAAINDQTTQLKDTTGSDTVAGDAVTDAQQQVNDIPIVNILDTFTTGVQQQVNTQEVDGTVTFPGMQMAGFTVPQAVIRPMSLVSEDMQTIIRTMVTFVFVQAFLRHLFHLIDVIFVIQDFGTLDVGMDTIERGPRVQSWSSDYDIDEDLGF